MIVIVEIAFWISFLGILHTYFLYPAILIFIDKTFSRPKTKKDASFPRVSIVFAAFNEEKVIQEKIHSLFKSDYPKELFNVYVGSDASTDNTDGLLKELTNQYENLHFKRFEERTGKSGIINELVNWADGEIIIGTDANIIFLPSTIGEFVKAMTTEDTQMIAGNILYVEKSSEGIASQEETYLSIENGIKQAESNLWKKVMGVSGGLYAIKKEWFTPIPALTFMEDFFVSFSILDKGGNITFCGSAKGLEDTSVLQEEEFKRKTRISIGNFQNLQRFKHLLYKQPYPVGFAFLSHKILRWITPFLGITTLLTGYLLRDSSFYELALYVQLSVLLLTVLDWLLYKVNINSGPLRFLGHFTMMNIAFLWGFYKYFKGVRSNVWQPTKRHQ